MFGDCTFVPFHIQCHADASFHLYNASRSKCSLIGDSVAIDEFFVHHGRRIVSVGCLDPRTAVEAVRWLLVLINAI